MPASVLHNPVFHLPHLLSFRHCSSICPPCQHQQSLAYIVDILSSIPNVTRSNPHTDDTDDMVFPHPHAGGGRTSNTNATKVSLLSCLSSTPILKSLTTDLLFSFDSPATPTICLCFTAADDTERRNEAFIRHTKVVQDRDDHPDIDVDVSASSFSISLISDTSASAPSLRHLHFPIPTPRESPTPRFVPHTRISSIHL
jgi:hypothetical protein